MEKYNLGKSWIQFIYCNIIGRNPQQKEIDNAKDRLCRGDSVNSIIDDLLRSGEYCGNVVKYLYKRLLDRDADPTGLAYYTQSLISGRPTQEIITELCSSSEFSNKYPNKKQFMESLYDKLLTTPDLGKWINPVNISLSLSNRDIIQKLLRSKEYATKISRDYYQKYIGDPDERELKIWSDMIQNGMSIQEVLKRFIIRVIQIHHFGISTASKNP